MRFLLISCLTLSAAAAQYETLTLKDGRVLDGWWDAETGKLKMDHGTIPIDKADIVSEAAAEPPKAPTAPKARRTEDQEDDVPDEVMSQDDRALLLHAWQVKDGIIRKAEADYRAALETWLKHTTLKLASVPALPANPRPSDTKAHDEVVKLNLTIQSLIIAQNSILHKNVQFDGDPYAVIEAFVNSRAYDQYLHAMEPLAPDAPKPGTPAKP